MAIEEMTHVTAVNERLPQSGEIPAVSFDLASDGIGWITIDVPGEPLNVINQAFIEDFERCLEEIERILHDPTPAAIGLNGIILRSGKPATFIAGADLKLLRKAEHLESSPEVFADQVMRASRRMQRICDRLESLPVTTVAAIDGSALGGGLEIALACTYRVAAESTSRNIGLVEVQLGLLPAGGGTQRLPRIVGLTRALGLILPARRVNPRQARRLGIVDQVVHPTVLETAARAWATKPRRRTRPKLSLPERAIEFSSLGRKLVYKKAIESAQKETRGHYPAPIAALDAVRTGREQGRDAGLTIEAQHFAELASGSVAQNLIDIFFATNDLKKEQREEYGTAVSGSGIQTIGVVGAGFMGAGISQAAAASGLSVRLRDVQPTALARGLKTVHDLTAAARRKRRFTRSEAARIENSVTATTAYTGFRRVDAVIEAVFEDLAIKRTVVSELEKVVSEDTIIATNTSSLPIGDIAAGARSPGRIVGMHFFSPVHKMPLVEVIRGARSSDDAVGTVVGLGQRLGKTTIVVADGPGFYTTRVLGFMLYEAALVFDEGGDIGTIDRAMTAFGFPIGPLALMDEVGLDVGAHVGETLTRAFPDRLPPSDTLAKLAATGRKGRKGGKGFYDYSDKRKRPDTSLYALRSRTPRVIEQDEVQERLSLLFVNEAAWCLSEGIVASARDGDVGAIMGLGFPPFLGGPFHYADAIGLAPLRDRLQRLEDRHGTRFSPAPVIRDLAARGGHFFTS